MPLRPEPKFRTGYIYESGYNMSSLTGKVENRVYLTDGFESNLQEVRNSIKEHLVDFDPDQDVLVLAGRSMTLFLATLEITLCWGDTFTVAIFNYPKYIFAGAWEDKALREVTWKRPEPRKSKSKEDHDDSTS